MLAPSATEIEEKNLAKFLFTHPLFSDVVLKNLGFKVGCQIYLEIPTVSLFASEVRPGDIDILIRHGTPAQEITAIEFKRVKIPSRAFLTETPTKIQDLKRGVHQANALYDLGFARVLLLIAIVTDGREQTHVNSFYRGPTTAHLHKIRNFPGRENLYSEIGLGFVELLQPDDKPIEDMLGLTSYLQHDPVLREPAQGIDESVQKYIESTRSKAV